jgi:acid ceramidase
LIKILCYAKNYDHWKKPPWFDDRVDPANKAMNAMGQDNLTLQGMYNVLSTKPGIPLLHTTLLDLF